MSKIRIAVVQHGGSSRIEVSALFADGSLLLGLQEGHPLHTWFRGPFGEQWAYTSLVHYRPAFRAVIRAHAARKFPGQERLRQGSDQNAHSWYCSLLMQWKNRLLVHFHPVLREVIALYASRIVILLANLLLPV